MIKFLFQLIIFSVGLIMTNEWRLDLIWLVYFLAKYFWCGYQGNIIEEFEPKKLDVSFL